MKRALLILSLATLVVLAAAIIGQVLTAALGIIFNDQGQPTDPTPLAYIVSYMAGIGGIIAVPVTLATFVLGLVAMGTEKRYRWLIALCVAGALSFIGFLGMAWVLLSGNSPIAFATPFILVPLVTVVFSLRRALIGAAAPVLR